MNNRVPQMKPLSQPMHRSAKIICADDQEKMLSLGELCKLVTSCTCPYEDLAEQIEDRAYEESGQGKLENVLKNLKKITVFFEKLKFKNEEIIRDLADVYLLIGQIQQYFDNLEDSINWFTKAIAADDQYSVPYHSCAISYLKLGRHSDAIRCLEQEILLSPGNYYAYLTLADLYKELNMEKMLEDTLKRLLERDPGNIQGLHRLIIYYELYDPAVEVQMLRRRLLGAKSQFNRIEMLIRAYHLCKEKRYHDVLNFIEQWHCSMPQISIIYLVKAHVFGELGQYTRKRLELAEFKEKNQGKEEIMQPDLQEFGLIFGKDAQKKLSHRLNFIFPNH